MEKIKLSDAEKSKLIADTKEQIAHLIMFFAVQAKFSQAYDLASNFEDTYDYNVVTDDGIEKLDESLGKISTFSNDMSNMCNEEAFKVEEKLGILLSSLIKEKLDQKVFGFTFPRRYANPEVLKNSSFFESIELEYEDEKDEDIIYRTDFDLFTKEAKAAIAADEEIEDENKTCRRCMEEKKNEI